MARKKKNSFDVTMVFNDGSYMRHWISSAVTISRGELANRLDEIVARIRRVDAIYAKAGAAKTEKPAP